MTAAIAASLVLHFALVWFVLQQKVEAPRAPRVLAVELVREVPPPVPKPKPLVVPKPVVVPPPPVPKPVVRHVVPVPVFHPKRVIPHFVKPPPPVMHFGGATADNGLGMDLSAPSAGSANGTAAIGAYDDEVKQRIAAAKTYPPGLPSVWNECVVQYRVTVDRSGNLLDYKITPCGNPFLDSAARAAILTASPFPVPPDFNGSQYEVFGSLIFRQH